MLVFFTHKNQNKTQTNKSQQKKHTKIRLFLFFFPILIFSITHESKNHEKQINNINIDVKRS